NLRDAEGTVGNDYGISGLPTTFVLDGRGHIAATLRGPQDDASLARALAAAAPARSATSEGCLWARTPRAVSSAVARLVPAATGQVERADAALRKGTFSVGMSSWSCQKGSWTGTPECQTERGARFEWPMTLRVYEEEPGGEPGKLVASSTRVQKMPYRPSESRL